MKYIIEYIIENFPKQHQKLGRKLIIYILNLSQMPLHRFSSNPET